MLDFTLPMPASFPVGRYTSRFDLKRGPQAVSLPGNLAGWCELLSHYGRKSLPDVLVPAITLARDSFALSDFGCDEINEEVPLLEAYHRNLKPTRRTFMNTPIHPKGWVRGKTSNETNHLNWGVKAGSHIYVAGMLATDPYDGSIVGVGDIDAQTRRVLDSIKEVIETAGAKMDDIVFNQIFLRDLSDYDRMNAIHVQYFPNVLPARFCVKLEMVKPEFLIEIATTAVIS